MSKRLGHRRQWSYADQLRIESLRLVFVGDSDLLVLRNDKLEKRCKATARTLAFADATFRRLRPHDEDT